MVKKILLTEIIYTNCRKSFLGKQIVDNMQTLKLQIQTCSRTRCFFRWILIYAPSSKKLVIYFPTQICSTVIHKSMHYAYMHINTHKHRIVVLLCLEVEKVWYRAQQKGIGEHRSPDKLTLAQNKASPWNCVNHFQDLRKIPMNA